MKSASSDIASAPNIDRATLLDPEQTPTVTVPIAAQLLGVSRATGYEGVASGTIPSVRIGRRLVVPVAALRRLLALDDPAA